MPIPPFHFGPGAAIHAAAPRYVSFLAFCAANVLMDIEPLYYILTQQYPLHRFFHTYVGAALVAIWTTALFAVSHRAAKDLRLPDPFNWQHLGLRAVAIGATAGTFSHILLDSMMHSDIRPFAPFSNSNSLLGVISIQALYASCAVSGLVAIILLGVQSFQRESS